MMRRNKSKKKKKKKKKKKNKAKMDKRLQTVDERSSIF